MSDLLDVGKEIILVNAVLFPLPLWERVDAMRCIADG